MSDGNGNGSPGPAPLRFSWLRANRDGEALALHRGDELQFTQRLDPLNGDAAADVYVGALRRKFPGLVDDDIAAQVRELIAARAAELARRSNGDGHAPTWPDPKPLKSTLPAVQPFAPDLLPDDLRGWVEDIAERTQSPIDFAAVGAMVALAAALGRRIGIRPRRCDDWLVVANLWGAIVAPPGLLKTPTLEAATDPLRRLEIEAREQHEAAMRAYEASLLVAEEQKKRARDAIRKALQTSPELARGVAEQQLAELQQTPPTRRRFIVCDATVEKLGALLAENPNGVLLFRDELVGWLRSLEREGQEGARAFFLECWSGTGRFTVDRIGRGTLDIPSTTLSLLGGIQPGPLVAHLRAKAKDGGDDGLIQRLQLAVWPDHARAWRNVDRWPATAAKERAYAAFRRLANLTGSDVSAELGGGEIPFLRFDDAAQEAFVGWLGGLEARIRGDDEHPIVTAHLAKYRSLVPSIALLLHLAAPTPTPRVGLRAVERAVRWAGYLETHARRVYAAVVDASTESAKVLGRKMLAGDIKDGFTARDVRRRGWVGLDSADVVTEAVEVLVDLGWLAEIEVKTAGRPRVAYLVNPKLAGLSSVLAVPGVGVSSAEGSEITPEREREREMPTVGGAKTDESRKVTDETDESQASVSFGGSDFDDDEAEREAIAAEHRGEL